MILKHSKLNTCRLWRLQARGSSALLGKPLMYRFVGSIVCARTGLNPFTRETSAGGIAQLKDGPLDPLTQLRMDLVNKQFLVIHLL